MLLLLLRNSWRKKSVKASIPLRHSLTIRHITEIDKPVDNTNYSESPPPDRARTEASRYSSKEAAASYTFPLPSPRQGGMASIAAGQTRDPERRKLQQSPGRGRTADERRKLFFPPLEQGGLSDTVPLLILLPAYFLSLLSPVYTALVLLFLTLLSSTSTNSRYYSSPKCVHSYK